MSNNLISTEHLDYLQRSGVKLPDVSSLQKFTTAQVESRLLWHIKGVGQVDKSPKKTPEKEYRSPYEDLIIGMHGLRIPMAFFVQGSSHGVKIHWGTWGRENGTQNNITKSHFRQAMLRTSLEAIYPEIYLSESKFGNLDYTKMGFSLGIPTSKPFNPIDGSMAMDRLIRAMGGSNWGLLILAEPAEENAISHLRGNIVEETRRIQNAVESKQAPLPLIKHYEELLGESLKNATKGLALGSWRTGVYLMGDELSYYHLASLWRGLYAGDKSILEPIRNQQFRSAFDWINNWALPDTKATSGPGFFSHPLAFQSILTSQQLSAYCHLPQLETPGFSVTAVPDFDSVSQESKNEETIKIGQLMKFRRSIEGFYEIELSKLTKHIFVAGVTGAGKTNTIFHFLKEVSKKNIPFLIIEPAKVEYRALLNDPIFKDEVGIFTCGNEQVSPFRLNPFEILPGASVSNHIDLLRSVFIASFGLWNPLPQILERCLHEIYEDRGWDVLNNKNTRLEHGENISYTYPTLSDLAIKVDQVTNSLGYEERVTADLRAALLTRINSLRTGGKGRLFDIQQSTSIEDLLSRPTILELEAIGDDDDKAFFMGLMLIRLATYRRLQQQSKTLQHLLVIEEAHRLLANVNQGGKQEESNPRGKAVETFSNLLSEIRAYGQGVLIADQVPVKLAPDVIKNTNLKIAHRIVAKDDRLVLAGAMAMNDKKAESFGILSTGEAIVFNEGDDAPLLIKIPYVKMEEKIVPEIQVINSIKSNKGLHYDTSLKRHECSRECQEDLALCKLAQSIVEDNAFQSTYSRIVLSIAHDVDAIDRLWPDLMSCIQSRRPSKISLSDLWSSLASHAAYWYANKRGVAKQWSYSDTRKMIAALENVFLIKAISNHATSACTILQKMFLSLHDRTFDPFPACEKICHVDQAQCLYRQSAAELIQSGKFSKVWEQAIAADATEENHKHTWSASTDAGFDLMEFATESWMEDKKEENHAAAKRVSLCFAQQQFFLDKDISVRTAMKKINNLIKIS